MPNWTTIEGQAIRKARLEQRLSQEALADLVGCTASRISELERAEAHGQRTAPSNRLWKALREALGRVIPEPPDQGSDEYANRTLTRDELQQLFGPLFRTVRGALLGLSGHDSSLHWALRRKLAKELSYDERGKPMHRKKLKALKRAEQDGKCASCERALPQSGAVLDRILAMGGYTPENTRLRCQSCDTRIQAERRYR